MKFSSKGDIINNKIFQSIPISCDIAGIGKINNNKVEDFELHHIALIPADKNYFNVPLISFDNFKN